VPLDSSPPYIHTVTTPYPPRDLTVVPLIAYERYYGEVTGRMRRGPGEVRV